jgi:membrane protein DedA with SNARE-associated domain/rhodanese-related sulfurtransferase
MNEIVQYLARHGYPVVFATVFARQLCLPVPAILFLLAAGAMAGNGKLNLALVIGLGVVGCVLADLVWFEAGRLRGDSVVHLIHRFSSASDANAARTKKLFARYGTRALVVAKFVIGLDAIAPPLAGMSGTSLPRFVSFDGMGATLWAGLYAGLGYVFYQQLDKAVDYAKRMGAILTAIVLLLVAILIGRRLVYWYRLVQELRLARITPEQLKHKLDRGEKPVIVDVQGCIFHRASHGAGIPGAIRIDGRRLGRYKDTPIPDDWRGRDVVLYCSCPDELTSARVARDLMQKGVKHVRPLAGGLQGWRARGYPVSPPVVVAPVTKAARAN